MRSDVRCSRGDAAFQDEYFKTASYANDRLGTAESVGAFTREDVLSFYRKMVNPTHSVLAVFGDVDPAKAKARIEEKFAGWSGAPVVKTLPEETRQVKENRLVEIKNEKNSAALFIGTNGLEVNNSERPVLDVISSILSGGGSPAGRIFDALRGGETNLVYAVHAFPFYGKNAGFFGVLTQTTMGNLDKVQQIIMANLKGLADEPVPANELERSKEAMLVGQKLGRETLDAQASSAALNEVLGLGWDYDKRYPEMVRAVSAGQVRGLARKLFAKTLTARTLPERPVEILASPPPLKSECRCDGGLPSNQFHRQFRRKPESGFSTLLGSRLPPGRRNWSIVSSLNAGGLESPPACISSLDANLRSCECQSNSPS